MEPVYILTHTKNCHDNFFPDNMMLIYHADDKTYYGDKSFYNNTCHTLVTISASDLQSLIDGNVLRGMYNIVPVYDTIINY